MPPEAIDPFYVKTLPWLVIGAWLFYSILAITIRWVRNLNYYIFESIPSTFVTLGLLGTFGGIAAGLYSFNTDPDVIKQSIQLLLEGLKTAMYTTLAGVSLSLLFGKVIQVIIKGKYVDVPESPELVELQQINEQIAAFKCEMVTGQETFRNEFQTFQSAMILSQRDALKNGLEQTLQLFNEIMDDFVTQLVEKNFEELGRAVKQLVDWQIEHRQDVAALLVYYRELTTNHEVLVENTATWIDMMDKIAGQSSKLQVVIDEFNAAFSNEGNLSKILRDVKDSTGELKVVTGEFGKLATSLTDTTGSMQVTGDKIDEWTKSVQQVSDASGQMISAVGQLRTLDAERLGKLFASIDELFLKYIQDLEQRMDRIPEDVR